MYLYKHTSCNAPFVKVRNMDILIPYVTYLCMYVRMYVRMYVIYIHALCKIPCVCM
jgi:hypothetical protein